MNLVRGQMRVVIAGGGVAALEALLALRELAGHLVDVTLLSPTREFVYRPVTVAEAFDRAQARVYDLCEIVADQGGGELFLGELVRVDPERRVAITDSGGTSTSVPAVVALVPFVLPATIGVARRGFREVPENRQPTPEEGTPHRPISMVGSGAKEDLSLREFGECAGHDQLLVECESGRECAPGRARVGHPAKATDLVAAQSRGVVTRERRHAGASRPSRRQPPRAPPRAPNPASVRAE